MQLYIIDSGFIQYLQKFDKKVFSNYQIPNDRPYVGVVFTYKNIDYFIPFSSPKPKHYTINNSNMDIFKLYGKPKNNKPHIISVLNINNMIPVKKEYLKLINVNSITKIGYKNLLIDEQNIVKKNKKRIQKRAIKLYSAYKKNTLDQKLMSRCCDFPLLEEKCNLYVPNLYIYIDNNKNKIVSKEINTNNQNLSLLHTINIPSKYLGIIQDAKKVPDRKAYKLFDKDNKTIAYYDTSNKKIISKSEHLNKVNAQTI